MASAELILELAKPLLPTIALLLGGKWILGWYDLRLKVREEELQLARAIREQQYGAVSHLYAAFSDFMRLYREINGSSTYPENEDERIGFLRRAVEAESSVDALILRISCEFAGDESETLEKYLGHMRQSVQLWREFIRKSERLPFRDSHQQDYARFKATFAGVAAFMVHRIHHGLTPPKMRMREASELLVNAFSNKYEKMPYKPVQDHAKWAADLEKVWEANNAMQSDARTSRR